METIDRSRDPISKYSLLNVTIVVDDLRWIDRISSYTAVECVAMIFKKFCLSFIFCFVLIVKRRLCNWIFE